MSIRRIINMLDETERRLDLLAAEIADERIDAERVAWLRTLLADYERLLRLEEHVREAVEYGETCGEMAEFSSGYVIAPDIFDAMKSGLADADSDATALMLRELWGMHRGLERIHGPYPPIEPVTETDDLPL